MKNRPFLQWVAVSTLVPLLLYEASWSLPTASRVNSDFGSLWESGRAASQGLDPYAEYPLTLHASYGDIQEIAVNRNTPVVVAMYSALSGFEPLTALRVWYAASIMLYVLTVALLLRANPKDATPLRVVWLASIAPIWDCLSSGQIHVPMAAFAVAAWLLLREGRLIDAGVLIGSLVAIKPHFAIWLFLLLAAGHTAVVAAAIASGFAISLLPTVLYGPNVYVLWLRAALETPWVGWPTNITLSAITARFGLPWLGLCVGLVLVAFIAFRFRRVRADAMTVSRLGLVLSLLAGPSGWSGYILCLLPVFLEQGWHFPIRYAAAAMVIPIPFVWALSARSGWHLALIGSLYGWILLIVLASVCFGSKPALSRQLPESAT